MAKFLYMILRTTIEPCIKLLRKSLIALALILLFCLSSYSQKIYAIHYFNDELLTNFQLNFPEDYPCSKGWCSADVIEKINPPFQNIYLIWDTLHVNPYKFDAAFKETKTIKLLQKGNFRMPAKGNVKEEFGFLEKKFNYGIDISCMGGDSVFCAFDGMVRVSKASKHHGHIVVVRHFNGLEIVYSNLAASYVTTNQILKAGSFIGTLKLPEGIFIKSFTGKDAPVSEFHFEMRYLGNALDPLDIIDFGSRELKSENIEINAASFAYKNEFAKKAKSLKSLPGKAKKVMRY
ncbi:MAG: hypothetical protein A2275_18180 [Bacteroidetes bacterium RIFOXYA12_FULL_35_11]|nr:MAG: hypothetical protein A2X01_20745 [Bacteroidetes bacterium GWF2_35_48]OFY82690.1 MAG: hypothetical protein A2275_18180 [Bacteroidetes bacterium RIFOXYA12_FULL_35_11]OFY95021.1 MAG: hypothetical protein A2491_16680 [Bacteroidetes bacterium RIFOXYC12_FULL_35_7]HBX51792.1 hypothetical protein [Bacteroidales bacterium]